MHVIHDPLKQGATVRCFMPDVLGSTVDPLQEGVITVLSEVLIMRSTVPFRRGWRWLPRRELSDVSRVFSY